MASEFQNNSKEADWEAIHQSGWKRFLLEVGNMDERNLRVEILEIHGAVQG